MLERLGTLMQKCHLYFGKRLSIKECFIDEVARKQHMTTGVLEKIDELCTREEKTAFSFDLFESRSPKYTVVAVHRTSTKTGWK